MLIACFCFVFCLLLFFQLRSPRWEDFELVVLTHSDMEPVQPYAAALSEVRMRPHSVFVMGEGLMYASGVEFHKAFQVPYNSNITHQQYKITFYLLV